MANNADSEQVFRSLRKYVYRTSLWYKYNNIFYLISDLYTYLCIMYMQSEWKFDNLQRKEIEIIETQTN